MSRQNVTFEKSWQHHFPGDTVAFPESLAKRLIAEKYARPYGPPVTKDMLANEQIASPPALSLEAKAKAARDQEKAEEDAKAKREAKEKARLEAEAKAKAKREAKK